MAGGTEELHIGGNKSRKHPERKSGINWNLPRHSVRNTRKSSIYVEASVAGRGTVTEKLDDGMR